MGIVKQRAGTLSKERIVQAAITILDAGGEDALTFRALAAHLATGSGALYWHVADKSALLAEATDVVLFLAMAAIIESDQPDEDIGAISLCVYDTIRARPWVGAQLSQEPWQPAVGRIFESIGRRLEALDIPRDDHFNVASALVNFILGAAGQMAAASRLHVNETDRGAFLANVVDQWMQQEPTDSFVRRVSGQLLAHDDRQQFVAGVNLMLSGLMSRGSAGTSR